MSDSYKDASSKGVARELKFIRVILALMLAVQLLGFIFNR